MGSLIKKRRKRMRKKKHKKMLKATRWQRRAGRWPHSASRSSRIRGRGPRASRRRPRPDCDGYDGGDAHHHPPVPGVGPATNHVDPLPASAGVSPVASPEAVPPPGQIGSTDKAAGSRSLPCSPTGPPSRSQARYTSTSTPEQRDEQRVRPLRPPRRTAAARRPRRRPVTRARPPTRQNGTSAPSRAAISDVGHPGPPQHRRRVGRPSAETSARRDLLVEPDRRPPTHGR